MFKNFRKRNGIILGLFVLIILNLIAFYIVKESIGISDALEHIQDETVRKSLEQKQILSDVLPSVIFTIDIALIFFGCYLLIKMLFKSLKKSTSTK